MTSKEIAACQNDMCRAFDGGRDYLHNCSDNSMLCDLEIGICECDKYTATRPTESELLAKLDDWEESHRAIIDGPCREDEKHCTCVPALRREIADLKEKLSLATTYREFCIDNSFWTTCGLMARIRDLRADKERLDYLESKGYGWICRVSTVGRGWRLHQTSAQGACTTVRTAIDKARK